MSVRKKLAEDQKAKAPQQEGPRLRNTKEHRQLTTARGFLASILWGSLLLHLRPNYHLGSVTEAKV